MISLFYYLFANMVYNLKVEHKSISRIYHLEFIDGYCIEPHKRTGLKMSRMLYMVPFTELYADFKMKDTCIIQSG